MFPALLPINASNWKGDEAYDGTKIKHIERLLATKFRCAFRWICYTHSVRQSEYSIPFHFFQLV